MVLRQEMLPWVVMAILNMASMLWPLSVQAHLLCHILMAPGDARTTIFEISGASTKRIGVNPPCFSICLNSQATSVVKNSAASSFQ